MKLSHLLALIPLLLTSCYGAPPSAGGEGGCGGAPPAPDAGAPQCLVPDPGVWEMQGTPCSADHDCARWGPCIDARCDLGHPQGGWPGTCAVSIQVEPVYCGSTAETRYSCTPQRECCPAIDE